MNKNQSASQPRCCALCPIFEVENARSHVQVRGTHLKGKGNANAVFGTTRGDGLVVRCRLRAESKSRAGGNGEGRHDCDDRDGRDERLVTLERRMWSHRNVAPSADAVEDQMRYTSHIVAPLLGIQYLPLATRLENVSFSEPPPPVLRKRVVTDAALLMTDGTLLAGIPAEWAVCIELKPKFGGIVRCSTVPHRHRHLKHSTSRYQLHQTLKLERDLIEERSTYDPLDLFSNDSSRMQAALEALMNSPQNNLAIFLAGTRVPLEETARGLSQACKVLDLPDTSHLASTLKEILAWEGILEAILRMQTLCEYDVQAIEALLRQMIAGDSQREDQNQSEYPRQGLASEMEMFLDRMARSNEGARLDVLADYCTSATAKDCSILISMANVRSREFPASPIPQGCRGKQGPRPCELGSLGDIAYRVTVVDLDRKSLKKVDAHKRLDEEILRANMPPAVPN